MSFTEKVTANILLTSSFLTLGAVGNFMPISSSICLLKLIFSLLIPVTEVLDRGILLQERVCEVYPSLSGHTQVNWELMN